MGLRGYPSLASGVDAQRPSSLSYLGPIFDVFDPDVDLRGEPNEGLGPDYVWGSFRKNPAQFTCEVDDAWDVAAVLRMTSFEP